MEQRDLRVIVETSRHRVTGTLQLPVDGYRSRLTDYLNSPERAYLALTDVEIAPLEGEGEVQRRRFVALSLAHIVLATHADEEAEKTAAAEEAA